MRSVGVRHQRRCIGSIPLRSFSRNCLLEQRVRRTPFHPFLTPQSPHFLIPLPLPGSIADSRSPNSRPSRQYHLRPPTCPPSLPLDVRPFPNGRLPNLSLHPLHPSLRLHSLGHLPDRDSHLPLRSIHHCRFHHRHSYVHHIQECDQGGRAVSEYRAEDWGGDVCVHVDCEWLCDCGVVVYDGGVLLLCV